MMFPVLVLAAAIAAPGGFDFVTAGSPEAAGIVEMGPLTNAFDRCRDAKAVRAPFVPTRNLLDLWREIGVKVYCEVKFDPESSADTFRRACGWTPFIEGADGVYLAFDEKTLPPGWKAALAAAREDMRVADVVKGLTERAMKSDDHRVRIDGRQARFFYAAVGENTLSCNLMRLESIALARHLSFILDGKDLDFDLTLPGPFEGNTLAQVPFKGESVTTVRLPGLDHKAKVNEYVSINWTLKFGFSIEFSDPAGKWVNDYIEDFRDLELAFYLPARQRRGEWNKYRVEWSHGPSKLGPRYTDLTSFGGPGEYRFQYQRPDACGMAVFAPPNRIGRAKAYLNRRPCRDYPAPEMRWRQESTDKDWQKGATGWKVAFDVCANTLFGGWLGAVDGATDTVYVEVKGNPRYVEGGRMVIKAVLPPGSKRVRKSYLSSFDCYAWTGRWTDEHSGDHPRQKLDVLLFNSWPTRFRSRIKSPYPYFMNPEEDKLFLDRVYGLQWSVVKGLADITYCSVKESVSPKLEKYNAEAKASAVEKMTPMYTAIEDYDRMRTDFLLRRFRGETPPVPEWRDRLDKAAEALKAPAKADGLNADTEDNAIELEEGI